MKSNDIELIQRILAGDEPAFTELVKKYQKPVHTLAWRKIGDFHIAEEITQDAFLKVYQRLHTLKNPKQFSGWLYVITSNLCATWLRKKRIQTQPLEDENIPPLEDYDTKTASIQTADAYSEYVVEQQTKTAVEMQRVVVEKLLAKLKESERTVMTLHYFGEMTCEEISRFLGVSASTVKSRLRRARQRLQREETMIREALDYFQISPHLTDNIMREVARLKPAVPSSSKPLIPWAIAASSVALIVLMLGIGSQYLSRFQQPYSLDAQAETTVELIDAPIVLNLEAKPDARRELGNANAPGPSDNNGQKPDEVLFAAAQTETEGVSVPKQQWIQENGPVGGSYLQRLFPTREGEIYTVYEEGWHNFKLYKLPDDRTEWQPASDFISLQTDAWESVFSMAKWNDTLYVVGGYPTIKHNAVGGVNRVDINELFVSTDGGETWVLAGRCPDGRVIGFEVMDDRFYLALEYQIFVSEDTGKTWTAVGERQIGEISPLKVIQNTLFAATSTGLYHLDAGSWKRLQFPIPEARKIVSLTGTENNLYVLTDWNWGNVGPQDRTWWLFRSTDKGQSWTDITPTNALPIMGTEAFEGEPQATLVAVKDTLLVIGWNGAAVIRSIDSGNTWTLEKTTNISLMPYSVHEAVSLNENTFYLQGPSGTYHSMDGGLSWTRFNPGMKSSITDLICTKTGDEQNTSSSLYALFSDGDKWVFKSSDAGKSWRVINPEIQIQEKIPSFTRIVGSDGVLYAKGQGPTSSAIMSLYRISEERDTLVPIKGMPTFDSASLFNLLHWGPAKGSDKSYFEQLRESSVGANQFFKQLAQKKQLQLAQKKQLAQNIFPFIRAEELRKYGLRGAFAVSGDTFYLEYNFKLFRWEPGDTEWYDTGQEETVRLTLKILDKNLKLAASGNTVYAGKRDGRLVVSFDKGTNWIDLTPALPFPFKTFKEIAFAGTPVYVATDAGVATSDSGKNWHAITDAAGTNLVMEHVAVDGTTVYGVTKDTGIYRLESDTWEQVVSDIPEKIRSLAVDGNTLYIGTGNNGMLHYTLEK